MTDKREKKTSTVFNIEDFSSTATLTNNEYKVPISGSVDTLNEKEYNPFEHRVIEHPNTFWGALIHLIKSSLGTGILAIPRAFKNAGVIVGLAGTVLIGMLCTYTIHLLVVASLKMCKQSKKPSLGFAETAGAVVKYGPKKLRGWSEFARNFVEFALVLTYYVGNAVYVVFISATIDKLVVYYYPETKEWFDGYIKLILLAPLILCCQIRELKHLVPFSTVANGTMLTALGITLYYIFSEIGNTDMKDVDLVGDISGMPLFYSTVIFAMEGIGTVLPVENSLLKPQFLGCPGVLNSAMSVVVFLYGVVGFSGYLRYGKDTADSVTLNLPSKEIPAQIAQACIAIAVFFTFMLQFYVPIDITWRRIKYRIPENRHNITQILLRTGLILFIVGIAAAAGDNLGPLIDLIGSIFFSTLGLFIPAALDTILNMEIGHGKFKWKLYKNILIMILAIFGLVSGSFYAIKALAHKK